MANAKGATRGRFSAKSASASARMRLPTLAAIDVGTNAVRLEVARVRADGELEVIAAERDAVRPGEGVFATGYIPDEVADRLLATLSRFHAAAKHHGADAIRAVATSAVREAKNRDDIVERAQDE